MSYGYPGEGPPSTYRVYFLFTWRYWELSFTSRGFTHLDMNETFFMKKRQQ